MGTTRIWTLPSEPTRTGDLLRMGVGEKSIATQLRRGELVQLRQGVYLASSAWLDDPAGRHVLRARAEIAANPDAAISHQSAAAAWQLPSPSPSEWADQPVAITLPAGFGYRSSRGTTGVHHVARLPSDQLTRDGAGFRITTPGRTAIDLAAGLPLPQSLVILDGAARLICAGFVGTPRRRDFVDPAFVRAVREHLLEVARGQRRTGLIEAIGLCEPCRESAAESLSAGYFRLAGLPQPVYQVAVRTPIGVFYPDCLWLEQRVIGECDGAVKYTDPDAYLKEKQREQALRDQGYVVVRWLAKEILTSPSVVVSRVGRALGW